MEPFHPALAVDSGLLGCALVTTTPAAATPATAAITATATAKTRMVIVKFNDPWLALAAGGAWFPI